MKHKSIPFAGVFAPFERLSLGILGLFALTFTACSDDFFSQTIEIDPPPYTKQMSFHLNLSDQDTSISVLLTRNYGILETVPNQEDYFLSGGSMALYKDGQPWLTLTPDSPTSSFLFNGKLPEPLQTGSAYEIRAEHPDYPAVSATQRMPAGFQVDSARVKRNTSSGQFGDKFDLVEVFLKDQPGVRNFYEVTLEGVFFYEQYDPNTGEVDTIYQRYSVYPESFPDPNIVGGVNSSGLISDQFFDGQSYKFQAQVYASSGTKLLVRVRHITEEYYRWSRSYQEKIDTDGNPLVEPVSVFTNLKDGLGIFAVAREQVFEVE